MLAKIVEATIDPADLHEATRAVRTELIPAFVSLPGACWGHWMADRSSGHLLIATAWSDLSSLRSSSAADGSERTRTAERIALGVRTVQTLEVTSWSDGSGKELAESWVTATWVEGVRAELAGEVSSVQRRVMLDERSATLRGSYWLASRSTGTALALAFWQRADAPDRSARAGRRRRRRRVDRGLGWRIGPVRRYEAIGRVGTPGPLVRRPSSTPVPSPG